MNYTQTVDYLFSQLPFYQNMGKKALKKDLGNIIKLCEALGNPHKKFKTIHVAGTNGKGSVSNYMAAYLQQNGYKVGLYTSPHLIDLRERIKINGTDVSEQFIVNFVAENQQIISEIKPSFFEITVAMAFVAFANSKVDYAIIETGLGGRLDSTNIINPLLSIITNIGLDHVDMLGDTLPKIAAEKGGIIKENTPIIIGERNIETDNVFIHIAQKKNAPIIFAEDKIFVKNKDIYPTFIQKNLTTCYAAIEYLGNELSFKHKPNNLPELARELTHFKGRWDIIQQNPKIITDTGHNVHAIKHTLKNLNNEIYEQLHIVFGAVAEKNVDAILSILPKTAIYYFCKPNILRGLDLDILLQKATAQQLKGQVYKSVKEAFDASKKEANTNDLIFVGGSTFVVGEVY